MPSNCFHLVGFWLQQTLRIVETPPDAIGRPAQGRIIVTNDPVSVTNNSTQIVAAAPERTLATMAGELISCSVPRKPDYTMLSYHNKNKSY